MCVYIYILFQLYILFYFFPVTLTIQEKWKLKQKNIYAPSRDSLDLYILYFYWVWLVTSCNREFGTNSFQTDLVNHIVGSFRRTHPRAEEPKVFGAGNLRHYIFDILWFYYFYYDGIFQRKKIPIPWGRIWYPYVHFNSKSDLLIEKKRTRGCISELLI